MDIKIRNKRTIYDYAYVKQQYANKRALLDNRSTPEKSNKNAYIVFYYKKWTHHIFKKGCCKPGFIVACKM